MISTVVHSLIPIWLPHLRCRSKRLWFIFCYVSLNKWNKKSCWPKVCVDGDTSDCAFFWFGSLTVLESSVEVPVCGWSSTLSCEPCSTRRAGCLCFVPSTFTWPDPVQQRLAVGGGGSLGEAKNTTPRIRQLHCRGIPRIAILHRVVGTYRCTNCQRVSLVSRQRHEYISEMPTTVVLATCFHLPQPSGWRI